MFLLSSPPTSMVASAKSDVYSILFWQINVFKGLVNKTDKHTQATCKLSGSIMHAHVHNAEEELILVKYNLSCIRLAETSFKPFHNAIIVITIRSSSTQGTVPFITIHHKENIYEISVFYFQLPKSKRSYPIEHQLLLVLESVLQHGNAAYKSLPTQPISTHKLSCWSSPCKV